MDGGPYRPQRPVDRRAVTRPAATQRQPEELEIIDDEPPKVVSRSPSIHHTPKKEKSLKKFIIPIAVVLGILVVAIVGWVFFTQSKGTASGAPEIDTSKYQAVFFTNGQVYFGKLHSSGSEYMNLTDIYYLQNQAKDATDAKNPQETATDQNGVQLIKLGDEIHGPEDKMIISKDQVLFYENLKTDGKVAKSIAQYKKSK